MAQDFFSSFGINDKCEFIPAYKDIVKEGIAEEPTDGVIVAVRFTAPKVWYDVLSIYDGIVYRDVPSHKVFGLAQRPTLVSVDSEKDTIL